MDALTTFYFDRCFGNRFPEALLKMQTPFTVEHHHSRTCNFPQTIADDEWLTIVGAKGWFVFSHDRKFHLDGPAIAAIKQHKIGCFYLWGAQMPTWEKYICLARAYHRIVERLRTPKPFIYRVTYNYRVDAVKIP